MPTANLTPEQMAARIIELEGQLATSNANQADFTKRLAGELAKHGVRDAAIATNCGRPSARSAADADSMTGICAAVREGTMSREDALAMRPKPEASVWVYQGAGPSARPTVIA